MNLLSLPNELLISIINCCDLQTLGRLSGVCRHLEECINADTIWKYVWEQLQDESPYAVAIECTVTPCYKSMCQRYVRIQRQMTTAISRRGKDLIRPIVKSDECDVLSLDIGSKTTWLKRMRGRWSCFEHTRTPCLRLASSTKTSAATITNRNNPFPKPSAAYQQVHYKPEDSSGNIEQDGDARNSYMSQNEHSKDFAFGSTPTTGRDSPVCLKKEDGDQKRNVRRDCPVDVENKNEWLDDGFLPKGPLLCTCVLCEPRVRVIACNLPKGNIAYPASCLHSDTKTLERNLGVGTALEHHTPAGDAYEATSELDTAISPSNLVGNNEQRNSDEDSANNVTDGSGFVLGGGDVTMLVHRLVGLTGLAVDYWHAVCQMCEPTGWLTPHLLVLVRTVFEMLGFSRLCLVPKPVCIAMALGVDTCLVVDSGAHHTQVGVVVNQRLVLTTEQVRTIGGAYVSQCLAHVLEGEGVIPKVCACQLDGRDIKEKCHLSHHTGGHRANAPQHLNIRSLRHPDGWCKVTLTEELSLAPEVMYLTLNLPEMIQKALTPLTFDLQKQLVANILLSGGNSHLNGLDSRLQLDLQMTITKLAPWVWVRSRNCMTTHDAVEGVSYVVLPREVQSSFSAQWGREEDEALLRQAYVTREDYIVHGAGICLDNIQRFWRINPGDL